MKTIKRAILASSVIGCLSAQAGTETPAATDSGTSSSSATGLLFGKFPGETGWDKAWSAFTLYKDENNPILQEFAFQGQLQVQYADGDSGGHFDIEDYKNGSAANEQSVWGDKFEARRARFGIVAKLYQNWKVQSLIDVDTTEGTSNLYRDIYDCFATYAPSDALNVSFGKTEVKFTRDYEISSKEILTFERDYLSNVLFPGELTGAWVKGKGIADYWLYELGAFTNDRGREFGKFDQGAIMLGKIGYDFASQAGLDTAVVSFNYLHNTQPGYKEKDTNNFYASASPSFTDSIALTSDITKGRFGLITELLYGFGFEGNADVAGKPKAIKQSDVFGISFVPSYFIADGVQLVGRVQLATSADADGLSLPNRYDKWSPDAATDPKGNTYFSTYLGVNYYLYGHKLKLMNGVEYSYLGGGNYDGYTFLSGLRMYF